MEPAVFNYFKEYFTRLHFREQNKLLDLINSLYSVNALDDLEGKLEFSTILPTNQESDLRIGLFKLYPSNFSAIISFFRQNRYDTETIEKSLRYMEKFAPEFGLGIDFNRRTPRLKLYFLRLPDSPLFKKEGLSKVQGLSKLCGINGRNLASLSKEDCYLIGVDYHKNTTIDLKMYLRTVNMDFSKINHDLKKTIGASSYFDSIVALFSEEDFRDVTYSYKYSNRTDDLIGFSIFFEVNPDLNTKIRTWIATCLPHEADEFDDLANSLTLNRRPITYSHIGLTCMLNRHSEKISLY